MLKLLQYAAVLAAVIFFLSILGIAYYSSSQSRNPSQQQTFGQQENENQGERASSSFIQFLFPDSISFFNFLLVIATVALAYVAIVQIGFLNRSEQISTIASNAAKDAANVAKSALIDVQRAFVFPVGVDRTRAVNFATGKTEGWRFVIDWKNSGTTQAKNLVIRTGGRSFSQKMPADYAFPETTEGTQFFGGPQSNISGGFMGVPLDNLEKVKEGSQFLYLFGSAEYDDVFSGTPRHRTEYCFQVLVLGDLTTDTNNVFVTPVCEQHNRTYDIDRTQKRDKYVGTESEHLSPNSGQELSLPPAPIPEQ